jgi:glucose-6-phosphate 1-dehydrogenase
VLHRRKFLVLGHQDVLAILTDLKAWHSAELRVVMEQMLGESITQMDASKDRICQMLFQEAFVRVDRWLVLQTV